MNNQLQKPPVTVLFVDYDVQVLEHYRAEGSYGAWSSKKETTVLGVHLTPPEQRGFPHSFEQFNIDADVEPGDVVYVLVLTYKTGDSFGSAEGEAELVWVFKNKLIANEALLRWKHACNKSHPSCTFRVDGGKWVKMSNVTYGYFEQMQSIELVQRVVS